MQPTTNAELDLRWFIPLFIGGWFAILAFLSFIGGWHRLSQRYPGTHVPDGRLFAFASMGLGPSYFPVSYGSCLFVRLGVAGISLSIFPIFRVLHPPLLIPWNAVSDCRRERFWFLMCTAVYISEPKTRMLFRGRLGKALYDYWSSKAYQRGLSPA